MATELENLVPEADVEIEGMRGPKGDKGDSYVLTEADKEEIAQKVDKIIDAETDKTLTLSGKPADAKVAGDEINDLKADLSDNLDFIYSSHYLKSNLALNSATVSRGIANSGAVMYDVDKTLSFYPVSTGDIVYLSLSGNTGTSTAVWEFTNVGKASSLSANNVVGSTHFDAINGSVTVPTGATYIAIAQTTGSTYIIQKLIPVDYQGEIHDIKKGAYEHIVGDFERGSILNGVNSTTTTRVRHIKPVSYSHDIFCL